MITMTSPPPDKGQPQKSAGTCDTCGARYTWDVEDTRAITRTERRKTSGLYRVGSVHTIMGIRCQREGCPGLVPATP